VRENAVPDADLRAQLKPDQKVIAENDEEIGEIVDIHTRGSAEYIHIRRYGPGQDDIYVPVVGVERVVANRVFLRLSALDLLGKAWHELPAS